MTNLNQLGNECLDNFIVSSNFGGIRREIVCENLANFPNSVASITAQTGGEAAGDAFYLASLATGPTWSWGLDNSDSNKFKVSNGLVLGVNDAIVVNPNGQVNHPLQPAFSAFLSGNVPNTTGNFFIYPIVYNSTADLMNQGICYNTATGFFTAPVNGTYFFYASAYLIPGATGIRDISIYLNKTIGANTLKMKGFNTFTVAINSDIYANVSGYFLMTAGEQVNVTVIGTGAAANDCTLAGDNLINSVATLFNGYLVS